MKTEEIIEMARQAGYVGVENGHPALEAFAKLVAAKATAKEREEFAVHAVDISRRAVAKEREAIAQLFEDAPALVSFAQNDQGGCLMCGFTPKMAVAAIRARGEPTSRGES